MIESTAYRVPAHSPEEANIQIERETVATLIEFARRLDAIDARIQELDQEWDIERTLEANAGIVIFSSLILGRIWPKLNILPLLASGFLIQHAFQGWCPPVSVFRRMGVRTMREIDRERYALMVLRGDFDHISSNMDGTREDRAIRAFEVVR